MALSVTREAAALTRLSLCPMCGKATGADVIALPGVRIDLPAKRAWIAGQELALTRLEFALLTYFAHRPGQAVTKAQLFKDVWGYRVLPRSSRTVDSHVSRLRHKIKRVPGSPDLFQSVHGVGWRFAATYAA